MLQHFRLPQRALLAVLLAAASGCTETTAGSGGTGDGGGVPRACVDKNDCGNGEVCSGGVCIQGECEVRDHCPFPTNQLCDVQQFKCIPDPLSPIGTECPAGDNDCDLGEFCFAGTCYDTTDRTTCVRSSQCGAGDRCDPESGYCVPNRGGCDLCQDYAELCCVMTEETCNPETKRCDINSGGIGCTVETQADDCRVGERCVDARCVQCTADTDCGPGTICNVGSGRCVSAGTCSSDEDCAVYPDRRCALTTHQCTVPQCTLDSQCDDAFDQDSRFRCSLDSFQCYLPPATCTETGEPNNAFGDATALTAGPNNTFSLTGPLCRGDLDVLSFPVVQGRRVEVTVTITPGGSGQAADITAELYLPDVTAPATSAVFTSSSRMKKLTSNVMMSGNAFVRINAAAASEVDSWSYSVEARLVEPLTCDTEAGEPNNTLLEAANSVLGSGASTRALCGDSDRDYHTFRAGAGKKVEVNIEFDNQYDLEVELLSPTGVVLDSTFVTNSPIDLSTDTTAATDIIIHIRNDTFGAVITDAAIYTLSISETDPPVCDDTALEPNNARASAASISPGTLNAVSCGADDDDYYSFTLATASLVSASLSFPSPFDLDLYLQNSAGTTVVSAAGSARPEVVAPTMMLAPGRYYLRVDPYSTFVAYPVRYTLSLTAPGVCMDDVLDEDPGNDSSNFAYGLRDSDSVDTNLNYENSAMRLCRGDDDWFRVLALGTERITAWATGVQGSTVTVLESTGMGPREIGRSYSTMRMDGTPEEFITVPVSPAAGIFFVRVSGGVTGEGPYALRVRTDPDVCESLAGSDAEPNDAMANALPALMGTNTGVFCPVGDRDVFKVQLGAGATLNASVAFDGAQGDVDLQVFRDAPASLMAEDLDVDPAASAEASVMASTTSAGRVNIVVLRKPGTTIQPYTLTVGVIPGSSSSSGAASGGSGSGTASSGTEPSSSAGTASSDMGTASSGAAASSEMPAGSSAEASSGM